MRTFIKYSLLLLNLVFVVLLGMTKLVPFRNPYEYNLLGLLGFFTPVLMFINAGFVVFWLISRKFLYLLFSVMAIWLSWDIFGVCFATHVNAVQDMKRGDGRFSVLSYNVRLLDLYHWNQDSLAHKKMIEFFRSKNADILCLQEFYTGNTPKALDNIGAIRTACGYPYLAECNMHVSKRGKWGNVVFSHYPIVYHENMPIDVQGNNLLQLVDIAFHHDTFSVYNVHLKSNRFNRKEAALVNKTEWPSWDDTTIEQSKSIFAKLQDNSVNRGLEAEIIANTIQQHNRPAIVCGDFNDIPSSYVYFKIRDTRLDAFLEKGVGIGATFRHAVPLLRIDYLFHDTTFNLLGFEKPGVSYSDHEPLFANFMMGASAAND